jgi:hypothetical protein
VSYIDVADLADAVSFKRRLAVAVSAAAAAVLIETPKPQQAWQDKRYAYALDAIRDPYAITPAFVWAVITDTNIATKGIAATDAELLARCSLVWDYVAGVTAADKV